MDLFPNDTSAVKNCGGFNMFLLPVMYIAASIWIIKFGVRFLYAIIVFPH